MMRKGNIGFAKDRGVSVFEGLCRKVSGGPVDMGPQDDAVIPAAPARKELHLSQTGTPAVSVCSPDGHKLAAAAASTATGFV